METCGQPGDKVRDLATTHRGSAWVSLLGVGLQTPPKHDRRSPPKLHTNQYQIALTKTQMETCGHPGDKVRDLATTHRGSAWVSRLGVGLQTPPRLDRRSPPKLHTNQYQIALTKTQMETCGHPGDKVSDLVTTNFGDSPKPNCPVSIPL